MTTEEKFKKLLGYHHMLNFVDVGIDGSDDLIASDGKSVYRISLEEAAKYKIDPSVYCLRENVAPQVEMMYDELEAKKAREVKEVNNNIKKC